MVGSWPAGRAAAAGQRRRVASGGRRRRRCRLPDPNRGGQPQSWVLADGASEGSQGPHWRLQPNLNVPGAARRRLGACRTACPMPARLPGRLGRGGGCCSAPASLHSSALHDRHRLWLAALQASCARPQGVGAQPLTILLLLAALVLGDGLPVCAVRLMSSSPIPGLAVRAQMREEGAAGLQVSAPHAARGTWPAGLFCALRRRSRACISWTEQGCAAPWRLQTGAGARLCSWRLRCGPGSAGSLDQRPSRSRTCRQPVPALSEPATCSPSCRSPVSPLRSFEHSSPGLSATGEQRRRAGPPQSVCRGAGRHSGRLLATHGPGTLPLGCHWQPPAAVPRPGHPRLPGGLPPPPPLQRTAAAALAPTDPLAPLPGWTRRQCEKREQAERARRSAPSQPAHGRQGWATRVAGAPWRR